MTNDNFLFSFLIIIYNRIFPKSNFNRFHKLEITSIHNETYQITI